MKRTKWLWLVAVFGLWVAACSPGNGRQPQPQGTPQRERVETQAPELAATVEPQATLIEKTTAGSEPATTITPWRSLDQTPGTPPDLGEQPALYPTPGKPGAVTPGAPAGREEWIARARADLAARLELDPQEIELVSVLTEPGEPQCPLIKATPLPQPVMRNRTTITLEAGDKQYLYLVEGIYVTLCDVK